MKPRSASLFLSRLRRALLAVAVVAGLFFTVLPDDAFAGNSGGRVTNPKRLRTKKEQASRGRIMKDPRFKPPVGKEPARAHAEIPSPEPRKRGGVGYSRKGQYFYEDPKPIHAVSNAQGQVGKIIIPHPNTKER